VSDFPANDMDDLENKKRARRRLVGATVLALLAVIALLLLGPAMGDNDESGTGPIQVSIPERGEPELHQAQAVPLENDAESATDDIEPDAVSGAAEMLAEQSSPPLVQPTPEQSMAGKPAPAPPVAQPSGETRQEKLPSRPGATEKETEAARALALLNDNPPAKGADQGGKAGKAQSQVFIQVGAFNKADGATKQVEELKKQGFTAYAEKFGKVTRVRIGPLSQSEGERVVARLKAKGHKAQLSSH